MSETTTEVDLAAMNEKFAAECAKMSNAALLKKMRHLRRTIPRVAWASTAERLTGFLAIALDEEKRRIVALREKAASASRSL